MPAGRRDLVRLYVTVVNMRTPLHGRPVPREMSGVRHRWARIGESGYEGRHSTLELLYSVMSGRSTLMGYRATRPVLACRTC